MVTALLIQLKNSSKINKLTYFKSISSTKKKFIRQAAMAIICQINIEVTRLHKGITQYFSKKFSYHVFRSFSEMLSSKIVNSSTYSTINLIGRWDEQFEDADSIPARLWKKFISVELTISAINCHAKFQSVNSMSAFKPFVDVKFLSARIKLLNWMLNES